MMDSQLPKIIAGAINLKQITGTVVYCQTNQVIYYIKY